MSEDNKTIIETAEKGTGLLGKLAALEKKYGFFGILKIIVLLFILGYVIYFVSNPTYLIDKMTEAQEARAASGSGPRYSVANRMGRWFWNCA